jgi:hypothetical protein
MRLCELIWFETCNLIYVVTFDTIAMITIICTVVLSVIQGIALNTGVLPFSKGRTLRCPLAQQIAYSHRPPRTERKHASPLPTHAVRWREQSGSSVEPQQEWQMSHPLHLLDR